MRNQVWHQFSEERQRLQARLGERLRANMSSLIGDYTSGGDTADVLLVAADGRKLAAHACILRQRAPIFFYRYVEPTLDATPRGRPCSDIADPTAIRRLVEVAVGDVDSTGLEFFIRSIYTDEEVCQLGKVRFKDDDDGDDNSNGSANDGDNSNILSNKATNANVDMSENGTVPRESNQNGYSDRSYNSQPRNNYTTSLAREASNTSSPDSLNADFSHDIQTDSIPVNRTKSGCLPAKVYSTVSSSMNCVQQQQQPAAIFNTPLNIGVEGKMTAEDMPSRMSHSYPSPDDVPMTTMRPLFGDALPDVTTTMSSTALNSIPNVLGAPPTLTSFRELAASCGGVSSGVSSRSTSVQQLPTPSDEFPSVTSEQWRVVKSAEPLRAYASPSRRLNQQRSRPSTVNKIFPMFINLNSADASPIARIHDARHSGGTQALMSRSYPQHADRSSGADSGTSTVHSASLTSSTSDTAATVGGTAIDIFDTASPSCSESTTTLSTLRSRTIRARRLSVTSLTSLTSIDLTPSQEAPLPLGDRCAASQLGADLLEMFRSARDADVVVVTDDNGEIAAHRCVLWTSCAFFRRQLRLNADRVELKGFSKASIHFLLSFLYGGLTSFPTDEEIDVWEVIALAIHLNLKELTDVAILNIRTYKCHFFHKPCATCVSAIFDALPQFFAIKCLHGLYNEALAWQAQHFARIWKGRVFTHLSVNWQNACLNALLERVDEENVIDVLLSCEKLQLSLARMKIQSAAEAISTMVANIAEFCTDYLIGLFDAFIASRAYRTLGMGLALNLSFLEEILPSLVHSLSAEVAIRTFIRLRDLIVHIQECTVTANAPSNLHGSAHHLSGSNLSLSSATFATDEWNPRFLHLNRRLFELTDRHLLHYAASVVKCDAWQLLSAQERNRIHEAGIFVEMEMPRAPPPRFSSLNRSYHGQTCVGDGGLTGRSPRHRSRIGAYKRSISAGVHLLNGDTPDGEAVERTRSLERGVLVETEEEDGPNSMRNARRQRPGVLEKITELNVAGNSDLESGGSRTSLNTSEKTSNILPDTTKPRKETLTQIIQNKTNQKFALPNIGRQPSLSKQDKLAANDIKKTGNEPEQKSVESTTTMNEIDNITNIANKTIKEEEVILQRQNTHTVMTMQQHREAGIDLLRMEVPQVTTADVPVTTTFAHPRMSAAQKPRSVVRPMPKNPLPLAAAAAIRIPSPAQEIDSRKRLKESSKNAEGKTPNEATKSHGKISDNKFRRSALPRLTANRTNIPVIDTTKRNTKLSGDSAQAALEIKIAPLTKKAHYLSSTLSLKARQNDTRAKKPVTRQQQKAKASG